MLLISITVAADCRGAAAATAVAGTRPQPAEQVDALFEPFRRLDGNRTSHPHGAGLGLSIVRSIVATHGGQLTAAARDGGLVVRIRLAATSAADEPGKPPAA
jgi:signal transduction histidine kinase